MARARRARRTAWIAVAVSLAGAPTAEAVIAPPVTLDGPSADVLEVGGVALASDGTGGIAFRKRVDGRSHVFAARFVGGRWLAAQRVDLGQRFDSTWPRIAAGDGGRLMVVWAQEAGPGDDRLFSAVLERGASRFGPPVRIDLDIGEATTTYPSVAMSPGGVAYVTYLVVTRTADELAAAGVGAGYVGAEVRAARWRGTTWSALGALNRDPDGVLRAPAPGATPVVVVGDTGTGLLAFQEPDDELVDRIWARRLFGTTVGIPLQVSPPRVGDATAGPADGFDAAAGGIAFGAVAYRQAPGPGDPAGPTRVLVNALPEATDESAQTFRGPQQVAAAAPGELGVPSLAATASGDVHTAVAHGAGATLVTSDLGRIRGTEVAAADLASRTGDVELGAGPLGRLALAWPAAGPGGEGVLVQERAPGRPPASAFVAGAGAGGPVAGLDVAGTPHGDLLVGFRQGGDTTGQVVAAFVDAPPRDFTVAVPDRPVRPERARVTWDGAVAVPGGVRYEVFADGRRVASGLRGRTWRPDPRGLGTGVLDVVVRAVDDRGQVTAAEPRPLEIDATPPRVTIRARPGRRIEVRVRDGGRGPASGVAANTVRVSLGGGRRAAGRTFVLRRLPSAGRRRVVVVAADRAGNRQEVEQWVRVR